MHMSIFLTFTACNIKVTHLTYFILPSFVESRGGWLLLSSSGVPGVGVGVLEAILGLLSYHVNIKNNYVMSSMMSYYIIHRTINDIILHHTQDHQ